MNSETWKHPHDLHLPGCWLEDKGFQFFCKACSRLILGNQLNGEKIGWTPSRTRATSYHPQELPSTTAKRLNGSWETCTINSCHSLAKNHTMDPLQDKCGAQCVSASNHYLKIRYNKIRTDPTMNETNVDMEHLHNRSKTHASHSHLNDPSHRHNRMKALVTSHNRFWWLHTRHLGARLT